MIISVAYYTGGGIRDMWLVNGQRVARAIYEDVTYFANRRDCMITKSRGNGRYVHHMSCHVSKGVAKDILKGRI